MLTHTVHNLTKQDPLAMQKGVNGYKTFILYFQGEDPVAGWQDPERPVDQERHPGGLWQLLLRPARHQSLRHRQAHSCQW